MGGWIYNEKGNQYCKHTSTTQSSSIQMSKYDSSFMREALVVAQEAYDNLEVPVGCVFVLNNDTIIARGRNKPNESYNVNTC